MWIICITLNYMEDSAEGRIYYEEGEFDFGCIFSLLSTWTMQLTCQAIKWSAEKHADFATCIGTYDADQLIFVDESAVDHQCGEQMLMETSD